MITEQHLSFDTAKLLKQAGFEAQCGFIILDDGSKLFRPTQQLAARWLREAHHIHVFAFYQYHRQKWATYTQDTTAPRAETGMCLSEEEYDTPEAALEAALQEALKQIAKNK